MSAYVHRYYLMADAAGAEWVRALFGQLGDGGPAEADNCRVPLSPAADPTGPPVYWYSSFVCTEAQRLALAAVEDAGGMPPGVVWCRVDAEGGTVRATNHPPAADRIGLTWDMPTTLGLVGLVFRRPAGMGG